MKIGLQDALDTVRDIVQAPVVNVMLAFAFILMVISYLQINIMKNSFGLNTGGPSWWLLIPGVALLFVSVIAYFLGSGNWMPGGNRGIGNGIKLRFEFITVNIKQGRIEEIEGLARDQAVVLPANTSFDDECITDPKSTLGSFVLKRFPDRVKRMQGDVMKQIEASGLKAIGEGMFPYGTTVVMPESYDTPARTVITASTLRKESIGFKSELGAIDDCVKQVLVSTATMKVSKLFLPILGSGHGRLDIGDALLTLVLAFKHYSKSFPHVREAEIIVTSEDARTLSESKSLAPLLMLGRVGK